MKTKLPSRCPWKFSCRPLGVRETQVENPCCKGWQEVQPFRKLEHNSISKQFPKMRMDACIHRETLWCRKGRKHFVKVHLRCIIRNLKKGKWSVNVAPPLEKFLRTPMVVTK